ncbi:D-3-phosphoglycerate dehydrogenase [Ameyamaea chiangmaiensis NBRC 103196]|uniref:D-3-phosphoglycerate dehydrogenase n=1 Tax=Ameyamaea chiangmaiensis TaxID=442969 RepID=A0A850P9S0_9PROT|nr:phosphoglycerate dehydrogenase [Ameyamaea chiangmaiensis]MBS4073676.1 phosphoglycerate dehydrogenase [Ameyamaea chiangmaiensis]NVN39056.1 phosphoglycerate dehydrogenase [Ameyamaea chiangmaiensis]GBQ68844.1 D-3-phosphoglycerate dehydrogenase [Ameyamaea chiangmaiensis NBRC 103196]
MTAQLSLPKDKIRILLLEGIHDSAVAFLRANGYENVVRLPKALEGDALREALEGTHIVGIRSRTQLTAEMLRAADRLMAVGCFCIGTNQVDLEHARNEGIPVFNAPFSNTRSVAELVMGEVVMLMRRIVPKSAACHQGGWDKSATNSWEVRGKTLGIVGYGSIGSQLSVLAEAFGMRVIYYDLIDKLPHGNATPVASLNELLGQSDVVTLHVPQTDGTRNLIGAEQIAAMKPGSFLLNNARGTVVDLDALADALKSGHLLGAAVDVFPVEPKGASERFTSPLQGLDNVILSPHIGGSTAEAQERIGVEVARKLVEYSDIGSTLGAVNFPPVQLPESPRGTRFMHVHRNVPGIMRQINEIFSSEDCNVTAQYLQTQGELGYVVVEADTGRDRGREDRILDRLRALECTIRARLLYQQV